MTSDETVASVETGKVGVAVGTVAVAVGTGKVVVVVAVGTEKVAVAGGTGTYVVTGLVIWVVAAFLHVVTLHHRHHHLH